MSKNFKLDRDPYDTGEKIFNKVNITLNAGVTILIGCNGAGKTTMLRTIEDQLKYENIPVYHYNNVKESATASDKAGYHGDYTTLATLLTASEGEKINVTFGQSLAHIGAFIREEVDATEKWLLIDAVDSGYSIDNIVSVKEVLPLMLEDAKNHGYKLNIVISTNQYEFCDGYACFDVIMGKYVNIPDYTTYKKMILESAKKKQKRYE